MTRIVQISDLHFGRARPELLDPLIAAIDAANPDIVAVSGDLTQRARAAQFRDARAFLDRLGRPWLSVPGNHDVPLYNPLRRWFRPHAAYRRWIGRDLEPREELGGVALVGLDTTDPYSWQRGKVTRRQIRRIAGVIEREAARRFVVIVAHHPFHHRPEVEKDLMLGAPQALDAWAAAGPHVILSGHLHSWLAEPFVARKGHSRTLQIHAGTGLSSRVRGEPNDFAVLTFGGDAIAVTRMAEADGAFADAGTDRFGMTAEGWQVTARGIVGGSGPERAGAGPERPVLPAEPG